MTTIGKVPKCYVKIYEFSVGGTHQKAVKTGSITVNGRGYEEVREVVEKALRLAFDSAPAET